MTYNFLWVIGGALFLGWSLVHLFFVTPKVQMVRSWYVTPVIGAVMCIMWLLLQVARILS